MSKKSTALLLILDGWGHREATDSNAIANAATPTWDSLWQQQPSTLLDTSGQSVGLPAGQMGNSEVGQFGNVNPDDVQTVEQILAEQVLLDELLQVLVSGRNDSHIDFDRGVPTYAIELTIGEHS